MMYDLTYYMLVSCCLPFLRSVPVHILWSVVFFYADSRGDGRFPAQRPPQDFLHILRRPTSYTKCDITFVAQHATYGFLQRLRHRDNTNTSRRDTTKITVTAVSTKHLSTIWVWDLDCPNKFFLLSLYPCHHQAIFVHQHTGVIKDTAQYAKGTHTCNTNCFL